MGLNGRLVVRLEMRNIKKNPSTKYPKGEIDLKKNESSKDPQEDLVNLKKKDK
jgi:hypothetical protein